MRNLLSRTKDEDDVGDDDSSDDEEPNNNKEHKDPKPTDEEPNKHRNTDNNKDPETPRPKAARQAPKIGVKAKWPRKPCIGFENTRNKSCAGWERAVLDPHWP